MTITQTILTDVIRIQRIVVAAFAYQVFILLAGCASAIDDISNTPSPAKKGSPTVSALLNNELKNAQQKKIELRAKLILDDSNEYDMDIVNGIASWQYADLSVQSPYNITVRFEVETSRNSGKYLLVALVTSIHDFSTQVSKTFQVNDLSTEFDEDEDGMSNLTELLVGGNPANPAPTILSETQITVLENSMEVLAVQAISPRDAPIVYSIANNSRLFGINRQTGMLRFKSPVKYVADNQNQYSVTVAANDGSFTTEQVIVVAVTRVFDLKVDIGLKQLQFRWIVAPGASYYKILQSRDAGASFKQLPGSANITAPNYSHTIAVHFFDQANTQFKLQAYDGSDTIIKESDAISLTVAKLNAAIGYVKPILTDQDDWFGYTVALSADNKTLVVAAPGENGFAGSVYIYSRVSGAWQPRGLVKAPNSGEGDFFGDAVALSADGKTLVVGAPYERSAASGVSASPELPDDNSISSSGAVYVFGRTTKAGAFSLQAYVKAPNSGANDYFGTSVALSASGNVLVVGADGEKSAARSVSDSPPVPDDSSARGAGAVYVFERTNSNVAFAPSAFVKAPNSEADDWFGVTVALSIDGNTLVVGATGEDSAATGIGGDSQDDCTNLDGSENTAAKNCANNSGAVYVFDRANNKAIFAPSAYVKAPNSGTRDFFGASVALSASGNVLVVGAYGEKSTARGVSDSPPDLNDNSARNSGAVYVFERASRNAGFDTSAYVKASNSEADDWFGYPVALSADGNTLVVGAAGEDSSDSGIYDPLVSLDDNSVSNSGAAYVFERASRSDVFVPLVYAKSSNSGAGDQFGIAVAISADSNTLVVGAVYESSAATGIGGSSQGDCINPDGSINPSPKNCAFYSGAVYLY